MNQSINNQQQAIFVENAVENSVSPSIEQNVERKLSKKELALVKKKEKLEKKQKIKEDKLKKLFERKRKKLEDKLRKEELKMQKKSNKKIDKKENIVNIEESYISPNLNGSLKIFKNLVVEGVAEDLFKNLSLYLSENSIFKLIEIAVRISLCSYFSSITRATNVCFISKNVTLESFNKFLMDWLISDNSLPEDIWIEFISPSNNELDLSFLTYYLSSQREAAYASIELYHKILDEHNSLDEFLEKFKQDRISIDNAILSTSTIEIIDVSPLFKYYTSMPIDKFINILNSIDQIYSIYDNIIELKESISNISESKWKNPISRENFHLVVGNLLTVNQANYIFNLVDSDFDNIISYEDLRNELLIGNKQHLNQVDSNNYGFLNSPSQSMASSLKFENNQDLSNIHTLHSDFHDVISISKPSYQIKKLIPNVEDLITYNEGDNYPIYTRIKSIPKQITELWAATIEGNIDVVLEQLQLGANVDIVFDGRTPLINACQHGYFDIAKVLLQHKAKYYVPEIEDTPLMISSQEGHLEIVNLVLDSQQCKDEDLASSLFLATIFGRVEIIKILIEKGVEIDCRDENGSTPLLLSCELGHVNCARILLQNGASPNVCNDRGETCLHKSINESFEIVSLLLEYNCNPNQFSGNGMSPLCLAIQSKNIDIVRKLIENGADPNLSSVNGPPLIYAVYIESVQIITMLCNAGAEVNFLLKDGVTPLFLAAERGFLEGLRKLLERKSDPNIYSDKLGTPLIVASFRGYTKIVRELLKAGSNLEIRQGDGMTAFLLAVEMGNVSIVRELVKMNANINTCRIQDGYTAIHIVAEIGNIEMLEELLRSGSNINYENLNGDSPLILSVINGHYKIIELLLNNGAKSRKISIHGITHYTSDQSIIELFSNNEEYNQNEVNNEISQEFIDNNELNNTQDFNKEYFGEIDLIENKLSNETIDADTADNIEEQEIILQLDKNSLKDEPHLNSNKESNSIILAENEVEIENTESITPAQSISQDSQNVSEERYDTSIQDEDIILKFFETPKRKLV